MMMKMMIILFIVLFITNSPEALSACVQAGNCTGNCSLI